MRKVKKKKARKPVKAAKKVKKKKIFFPDLIAGKFYIGDDEMFFTADGSMQNASSGCMPEVYNSKEEATTAVAGVPGGAVKPLKGLMANHFAVADDGSVTVEAKFLPHARSFKIAVRKARERLKSDIDAYRAGIKDVTKTITFFNKVVTKYGA